MKKTIFIILVLLFTSLVSAQDISLKDISSVKLNSISVDNNAGFNHLRFVIKAEKAGNFQAIIDIKKAAQKSLEYFFIGLSMPEDKFWVNLNPDEPFRIIDAILSDTDLGRIMLNTDLKLKGDVADITNPQTSIIGREFWDRLNNKAKELGIDKIPVMTRLWIVPDEVKVFETENQLSIIKSKLKACLESAYLSQRIEIKDKRQKELQDYASILMEELILPILNKKVNESYSYADLREVYQALILARWYKEKFSYQHNSLLQTVNVDVLKDTEIDLQYSPDEIYRDYLKSLKEGEYSFTETNTERAYFYTLSTTRHYFSGGVDFRNIKITTTSSPLQSQPDEDSHYLTCDLYIPEDIKKPLQYAKNQLELTQGNLLQHNTIPVVLVSNLPAITPIKFAEQSIQGLDSVGKTDKLVLSKL